MVQDHNIRVLASPHIRHPPLIFNMHGNVCRRSKEAARKDFVLSPIGGKRGAVTAAASVASRSHVPPFKYMHKSVWNKLRAYTSQLVGSSDFVCAHPLQAYVCIYKSSCMMLMTITNEPILSRVFCILKTHLVWHTCNEIPVWSAAYCNVSQQTDGHLHAQLYIWCASLQDTIVCLCARLKSYQNALLSH